MCLIISDPDMCTPEDSHLPSGKYVACRRLQCFLLFWFKFLYKKKIFVAGSRGVQQKLAPGKLYRIETSNFTSLILNPS
ncbi:unnamed protein product [Allacma fusca]|uniref:Uncharacterized protein n=1 Tax=Allacma fusca TaxID=39272 RepID=A0A8J2PZ90_9HEXA|nr:unnamed protein product [Allacma fusca]